MQRKNPNVCVAGRLHRRHLAGMGMGSVLLAKGGAGSGSSYPSIDSFVSATGREVGSGLGEKLNKLIVKPLVKKPHNIQFNF